MGKKLNNIEFNKKRTLKVEEIFENFFTTVVVSNFCSRQIGDNFIRTLNPASLGFRVCSVGCIICVSRLQKVTAKKKQKKKHSSLTRMMQHNGPFTAKSVRTIFHSLYMNIIITVLKSTCGLLFVNKYS